MTIGGLRPFATPVAACPPDEQSRRLSHARKSLKQNAAPLAPFSLVCRLMETRIAVHETEVSCGEPVWSKDAVAEFAAARLRQLVAQQLGVDSAQLGTESSLAEDLAADEMDLLEIAVALEEEFGLVVSDAVLGKVRTYGDLLESFTELLQGLADSEVAGVLASAIVRVRVIRDTPNSDGGALLRSGRLTPRAIERVVEEALCTAGVTRLELACSANTSDRQLARIAQRLAWLRNRGIEVSVRRLEPAAGVTTAAPEPARGLAPRSAHNQGG